MSTLKDLQKEALELGIPEADKMTKAELERAIKLAKKESPEGDAPEGDAPEAAEKKRKIVKVQVTGGNIKAPHFVNIPAGKKIDAQSETDLFGMIKRKLPESLEHISGSLYKVTKTVSVNVSKVIPKGTPVADVPKEVWDSVKHLKGMLEEKEMIQG
jgi:hypothetical protein